MATYVVVEMNHKPLVTIYANPIQSAAKNTITSTMIYPAESWQFLLKLTSHSLRYSV